MWNYHYPLSTFLYAKIALADKNYGTFLHDTGYKLNNKKNLSILLFQIYVAKLVNPIRKDLKLFRP